MEQNTISSRLNDERVAFASSPLESDTSKTIATNRVAVIWHSYVISGNKFLRIEGNGKLIVANLQ